MNQLRPVRGPTRATAVEALELNGGWLSAWWGVSAGWWFVLVVEALAQVSRGWFGRQMTRQLSDHVPNIVSCGGRERETHQSATSAGWRTERWVRLQTTAWHITAAWLTDGSASRVGTLSTVQNRGDRVDLDAATWPNQCADLDQSARRPCGGEILVADG